MDDSSPQTKPASTPSAPASVPGKATPRQKPSWTKRIVFGLVPVLLIAGLAYSGWQFYQQGMQIQGLSDSQNELVDQRRTASSNIRSLESQLSTLKATLEQTQQQVSQQQALLGEQRMELQRVSDQLLSANLRQREQVSGIPLTWRLEEVSSLLSLARQQLQMSGNKATAIALMLSADETLKNLDDSSVLPVRSGIARDLSQVRSMPDIDLEGIYLRLSSLSDAVNSLSVKSDLKDQLAAGTETGTGSSFWRQALRTFITVRRIDTPLDPMLSSEQVFTLKSRIQLLIEQAQQAARTQDQGIYQSALAQAADLVSRYFEEGSDTTRVLNGLADIQTEQVATQMPAADAGLIAVRQVLAALQRAESAELSP